MAQIGVRCSLTDIGSQTFGSVRVLSSRFLLALLCFATRPTAQFKPTNTAYYVLAINAAAAASAAVLCYSLKAVFVTTRIPCECARVWPSFVELLLLLLLRRLLLLLIHHNRCRKM